MTQNFFADAVNFSKLIVELDSWKGTPYSQTGICKKKIGADCVHFVESVLVSCGAIRPISWPKYVRKNGGPAMLSLMLETLDAIPTIERIWTAGEGPIPAAQPGHILVISSGKAHHHLSIVGNPPQIWHCLEKVEDANFFDFRHHLFAAYEAKKYV